MNDPYKYLNSLSIWCAFTCVCVCVCRESESLDSSLMKTNQSEGLLGDVAQITALSVGTRPACMPKPPPALSFSSRTLTRCPPRHLHPPSTPSLFILLTPTSSEIWNSASSFLLQYSLSVNPPLHLSLKPDLLFLPWFFVLDQYNSMFVEPKSCWDKQLIIKCA